MPNEEELMQGDDWGEDETLEIKNDISEGTDDSSDDKTSEKQDSEDSEASSSKSEKKKPSNFKTVYKEKKALEKKNADLQAQIDALSDNDEDEEDDTDDEENDSESNVDYDKTELLEFILDNPEAKEHKQDIIDNIGKVGKKMSFAEAFKLAKTTDTSKSKTFFDTPKKNRNTDNSVKLSSLNRKQVEQLAEKGKISGKEVKAWMDHQKKNNNDEDWL